MIRRALRAVGLAGKSEPVGRPVKQESNRALGYCDNSECSEFHRGIFMILAVTEAAYKCHRCAQPGHVKRSTLDTEDRGFNGYKRAVVHFAYSPALRKYQYVAIVELDEVVGGNVLILEDPLIITEKRALKVAEMRLSAANAGDLSVEGRLGWVGISFDVTKAEWQRQLEAIELRGRTIHRRLYGE